MKRRIPLITLAALALAALLNSPAHSQTSYIVTPITGRRGFPNNAHYSININGQISGTLPGTAHAFRWDPTSPNATTGTLNDLGGYNAYAVTWGCGINSLGDVVGFAGDTKLPQALLWPYGASVQSLGGGGAVQEEAYAINRNRDVAILHYSSKNTSTNGVNVSRIVSGKRKEFFLGAGWPEDINDAGQALGYFGGNGPADGVPLWTPTASGTSWTLQKIVPDGLGYDLNENGEAVGRQYVTVGGVTWGRPYLYLPAAKYGLPGGTNDLWNLIAPALPSPTAGASWLAGSAYGLNDNGTVIGDAVSYSQDSTGKWVAVDFVVWLWDSVNGARSLSALVAPAGWTLTSATHQINNDGQIVATATNGIAEYCVLLTPVL